MAGNICINTKAEAFSHRLFHTHSRQETAGTSFFMASFIPFFFQSQKNLKFPLLFQKNYGNITKLAYGLMVKRSRRRPLTA